MQHDQPSRRNLLAGFVAGLFGWLFPRPAPAAPRPPKGPRRKPWPFPRREPNELVITTTYVYDAQGRCTLRKEEQAPARSDPAVLGSPLQPVTTYVYDPGEGKAPAPGTL